ncbi:uncharacterized protein PFL1_03556 [Pseudozyma flocculosa PF-1]|uniref:Related to CPS1 - Gly-X carboxypeptidase YSCS n=2 Tax=Pseudozyma flocculosa TaxID=84751 RepID=A0A5C3F5R7_9BASI|nr:uncharacterized protein PFL1_03556 [Pseudozyma flocculosa PF-1]EPQ28753.1 hypothetical protein PFL1_03556 [Pseudozyma flocculosa PF-1]SPO39470.1 related to CPS1 - Gly-X carboxypeptidase YSCS precursor [Pseudozyma flocculosa]
MVEKAASTAGLLGHAEPAASARAPRRGGFNAVVKAILVSACTAIFVGSAVLLCSSHGSTDELYFALGRYLDVPQPSHLTASCPQQQPYQPKGEPASVALDVLADRLSKAIQIDTTVGDNWPSPKDDPERWRAFDKFADYLRTSFPRAHERLELEKINEHGLLYTWKGSQGDLKPLLMMAHQDVVPVNPETLGQWVHPPFDGYIDRDNQTVWGRGATDCKSWLVSIMSTVEAMLERGFEPKRTILFSFGFDEESNGPQGAAHLSARIEEVWGRDSIAMLVDEGNPILSASDPMAPGISVALPGVEEKGLLDIEVTIETSGGHSSAPPPHTSIGLVSRAVAALEDARDRLEADHLIDHSASLTFLQCIRDAPGFPPNLRTALKDLDWASRSSIFGDASAIASLPLPSGIDALAASTIGRILDRGKNRRIRRAKERIVHAMPDQLRVPFLTTTAADVIHGGVKLNALPESASAFLDHRIASSSGIDKLHKHYIKTLTPLAREHGLSFEAFGNAVNVTGGAAGSQGKLTIKHLRQGFEPAPNTPLVGDEAAPWNLFSSIIRSTWKNEDGSPVLVAPSMMQGNTDSRYFNNLTKHIFRFGPNTVMADKTGLGAMTGVHTINEHFAIQGLGDAVRFYSTLFQAVGDEKL